jgi:hypothetical protein
MHKPISDTIIDSALENPRLLKYFKIAGIAVSSVLGLYLLGHLFKVGAHTINGFNQLKSSIKNGKEYI